MRIERMRVGGAGVLVMFLAVGGGLGIGFGLHRLDVAGALPFPARARPAPPASGAPAASAEATAEPTASAATSAEAAPPAAPGASAAAGPDDRRACLAAFFPEGTFEGAPRDLGFVCDQADAPKVVSDLKVQLVEAGKGRGATDGMKEWAVMGMYDLAALAVLRGRCCSGAEPMKVPDSPATCEPLADALVALAAAAAKDAAPGDLNPAVEKFDAGVRCIMRFRQTEKFGGYGPLLGGEASNFRTIAARL